MRIEMVFIYDLDILFSLFIDCGIQAIQQEYYYTLRFFVIIVGQSNLNTVIFSLQYLKNNDGVYVRSGGKY
jgi:hypothetical protein